MTETPKTPAPVAADPTPEAAAADPAAAAAALRGPEQKPGEIGGPQGPEPTRYGDWAFKGRCSDF